MDAAYRNIKPINNHDAIRNPGPGGRLWEVLGFRPDAIWQEILGHIRPDAECTEQRLQVYDRVGQGLVDG